MYEPAKVTILSDGKNEQNRRVAVTILIKNGDSHYGGLLKCFCIIGLSLTHQRNNRHAITLDCSFVRV